MDHGLLVRASLGDARHRRISWPWRSLREAIQSNEFNALRSCFGKKRLIFLTVSEWPPKWPVLIQKKRGSQHLDILVNGTSLKKRKERRGRIVALRDPKTIEVLELPVGYVKDRFGKLCRTDIKRREPVPADGERIVRMLCASCSSRSWVIIGLSFPSATRTLASGACFRAAER
jgi:hypothetical protein